MPTELSIKRIVLRAVALKMATWSQAILHRLEPSGRAESQSTTDSSAGELIEKTSSAPPVSAEEVSIKNFGAEPLSGGLPVHWLERIRQRAPQLLRPVHQPVERTPLEAGIPRSRSARTEQHTEPAYPATDRPRPPLIQSTAFRAQAEQKRLKHGPQSFLAPAPPRHKSSENQAKFPTELSKRLPKRLPVSLISSPRRPHAQALDRKENSVARVRSSNISRDHLRETGSPEPAHPETPFRPHESRRTASVFCRDGMIRAAPGAASLNFPLEPFEDPWPQLPEPASPDPSDEHLASVRDRERWRRLDDEQRGIYGARRIST